MINFESHFRRADGVVMYQNKSETTNIIASNMEIIMKNINFSDKI